MPACGGYVIGICNGFQVLTEAGLLPGALMRNAGLTFLCKTVSLRVATTDKRLYRRLRQGAGDPRADRASRRQLHHRCRGFWSALRDQDRIAFTYAQNPNGATAADIAGVLSETAACWA